MSFAFHIPTLTSPFFVSKILGPLYSFASYLVKNDTNVAIIQRLLGHSSLHTTSLYLHVNQDELKNAVNKIDY
ncbi:hypothetical protein EU245_14270 [Lentibacillus lipolyticus]|nr:hypothetical protein EU245_14270 [Lentibacillus lipolyticus]